MVARVHLASQALDDTRRLLVTAGREVRAARLALGISQREAAHRVGLSASQLGRIERTELRRVAAEDLCRAGRAVGLEVRVAFYPSGTRAHDRAQLALLARFERLLAAPLRLRREVPLPLPGDQRAWDGRIEGGDGRASVEGEAKLLDLQAVARRIGLKSRDDPLAGSVILVVNRTAANRRVLSAHRETLRAQFPLDGAAIARALRTGQVPPAGGIILV